MGLPKLYRIIEAPGNCTFDDLHKVIFRAFDREEEHLYSFFITGKDTRNIRMIYDSPEITNSHDTEGIMSFGKRAESASKTRIGDVGLNEKDVLHYWFDYGDDWWHRIRVQHVDETKTQRKRITVIKSVGESPPQYPDYDYDFDEEYE